MGEPTARCALAAIDAIRGRVDWDPTRCDRGRRRSDGGELAGSSVDRHRELA